MYLKKNPHNITLQSDLIIQKTGDTCEVIGMIELGKEELSMRILECGKYKWSCIFILLCSKWIMQVSI